MRAKRLIWPQSEPGHPAVSGRGQVSLLQTYVGGCVSVSVLTDFSQSLALHRPLGPGLSIHLPGQDLPWTLEQGLGRALDGSAIWWRHA